MEKSLVYTMNFYNVLRRPTDFRDVLSVVTVRMGRLEQEKAEHKSL